MIDTVSYLRIISLVLAKPLNITFAQQRIKKFAFYTTQHNMAGSRMEQQRVLDKTYLCVDPMSKKVQWITPDGILHNIKLRYSGETITIGKNGFNINTATVQHTQYWTNVAEIDPLYTFVCTEDSWRHLRIRVKNYLEVLKSDHNPNGIIFGCNPHSDYKTIDAGSVLHLSTCGRCCPMEKHIPKSSHRKLRDMKTFSVVLRFDAYGVCFYDGMILGVTVCQGGLFHAENWNQEVLFTTTHFHCAESCGMDDVRKPFIHTLVWSDEELEYISRNAHYHDITQDSNAMECTDSLEKLND